MTKRFSRVLFFAVLAALVVGCSSSSNEPGGSTDLSATWTISASSSVNSGVVFDGSAVLVQSGTGVTGTFTCTQTGTSTCENFPTSGTTVTGTVSGASVDLSIATNCGVTASGGSPVVLVGTINTNGLSMTGTYSQSANSNPNCPQIADAGLWTGTKP
ncbi:MAG: hypothetical protein ABSD20_04180 [Terriglobales bacterium]